MKNYNVSDEPVTEVAVDINDIKYTCKEKGRNEECVFLVAGRMIYRKGLDFLFDALMRIPYKGWSPCSAHAQTSSGYPYSVYADAQAPGHRLQP